MLYETESPAPATTAQLLSENRELRFLLREARAAIEPLTGAQIKLHRIKLDLADRIDTALGVSELGHQVIRTAGTDEGKPTL